MTTTQLKLRPTLQAQNYIAEIYNNSLPLFKIKKLARQMVRYWKEEITLVEALHLAINDPIDATEIDILLYEFRNERII